jgi:tRNA 2-selenouridine synthase
MATTLPIDDFLRQGAHIPIVDVRSPAEFAQGHIPGALNLPLFSDEERACVGTLYVQKGRTQAVQKGLEIVGPKLHHFTDFALKLHSPTVALHCWRGGMRSASMAWLFETVGLQCTLLQKGYKAFRQTVLDSFSQPRSLQMLGGLTGSGKTEILHALALADEQVLDLEGLACHKGSAFGSLGQAAQPGTEQFENLLFMQFSQFDAKEPIWMEDESRNVGRCAIPAALWEQMRQAPFIHIDTPREVREQRLMREYAHFEPAQLCVAIQKIEKRLGFDRCKTALEACEQGRVQEALCICLDYYDKAYTKQMQDRQAAIDPNNPPCPRFVPSFPLSSTQIKQLKQLRHEPIHTDSE